MSGKVVKLGDVMSFSNGVNFSKDSYGKGIKLISVSDFKNRIVPDYETLDEVKKEAVKDSDLLANNDIVFVRSNGNKNLVGRCMLVSNLNCNLTFSGFCIRGRVLNQKQYDPVFLTYYFKSDIFRNSITSSAAGTNIQNLSQGLLKNYEAVFPEIDKQRRIAGILRAYDQLIENNRRQIALLEEAAQRLYKEWFVDLHFPGYKGVRVVKGVPESWETKTFSDVCQAIGGGTPSTKIPAYWENGTIPWATPSDVTSNFGWYLPSTEKKITDVGLANSSAKLLPAGTILMTSRASIGYFAVCNQEVCTNQGFISCIPLIENAQWWLLCEMQSRVSEFKALAKGSTFLELGKTTFRSMPVVVPDTKILARFNNRVDEMYHMMVLLRRQHDAAREARDRLLPKLMSGEIDVSNSAAAAAELSEE